MKKTILAIAITLIGSTYASFTMSPHFIVLTESKATNSVRVLNSGTVGQVYNVTFLEFKQEENGGYKQLKNLSDNLMASSPFILLGKNTVSIKPQTSGLILIYPPFTSIPTFPRFSP